MVTDDAVGAIRAFSRFYTNQIGMLREGLLDSPYSLTEARVIYELAQRETMEVADLRRLLDIDAGYLSRILARFAADRLILRERSATDGRRQTIRLTAQGRKAFRTLDRRSSDQIVSLLSPLAEPQRRRLVTAMQTITSVIEGSASAPRYRIRPPQAGDFGWVIGRHGAVYADQYGWDQSFEALVARIVADYAGSHDPSRERAWIAEIDGEPVGCIFCVKKSEQTAQLRLLLVEPRARGLGIGRALVEECLSFARQTGYREMVLWTNDVLTQARRLYERLGFSLVDEERHHSFGHDLVGQHWSRPLQDPSAPRT